MAEVTVTTDFSEKLNRVCYLKRALFQLNNDRTTHFTFLKPKQIDTLYALSQNRDTVSVLPTGYGKSLIFNLLPYYFSILNSSVSKIIIISPLNAIIEEQAKFNSKIYINVNDSFLSNLVCEEGCSSQFDARIFIGHPENILCKKFLKYIHVSKLEGELTHIVIDEAHCICLWGTDFRPKFRDISVLRSFIPNVVMFALTATATSETITEICNVLKLKHPEIITASVDRPNIYLEVEKRLPSTGSGELMAESSIENCATPILQDLLVNKNTFRRTIIYTSLKGIGLIMELAVRLSNGEVPPEIAQYHAPQTSEMKTVISDNMKDKDGTIKLLLATQAYGMGADSPNIQHVVHIGVPTTLESYLQEIGRGGRDGNPAKATLYYNQTDLSGKHVSKSVVDYIKTENCRREYLCEKFNCQPSDINSICCDNCDPNVCQATEVAKSDMKSIDIPESGYKRDMFEVLNQYFNAENSLVPGGSLVTCLTENIAKVVVSLVDESKGIAKLNLELHCPYVKQDYLNNIYDIMCHYFYGRDIEETDMM